MINIKFHNEFLKSILEIDIKCGTAKLWHFIISQNKKQTHEKMMDFIR